MDCKTCAPYPEVSTVCQSEEAVRLLRLDFAGAASEMTALHTYMYQSEQFKRCYPNIAQALECIGIVEMTHATYLQQAIITLGGDARYMAEERNEGLNYWAADKADYALFVRDMLMRDIADEKAAIVQYTQHAEVIPIPQVSALLLRIAEDERLHVVILTQLLNAL